MLYRTNLTIDIAHARHGVDTGALLQSQRCFSSALYDCTIPSKQEFLPTKIQNHALMRIPIISITKQEAGKHNAGA
jgi:hypothetical protein